MEFRIDLTIVKWPVLFNNLCFQDAKLRLIFSSRSHTKRVHLIQHMYNFDPHHLLSQKVLSFFNKHQIYIWVTHTSGEYMSCTEKETFKKSSISSLHQTSLGRWRLWTLFIFLLVTILVWKNMVFRSSNLIQSSLAFLYLWISSYVRISSYSYWSFYHR